MKEYKKYKKLEEIVIKDAKDTYVDGILALEGGALRGIYTAGVLDALMEFDINIKDVVGVSAGALNGANYIAGNIGRGAYSILKYRYDPEYVGLAALKKSHSIIGFDFMFKELPKDVALNEERLFRGDRKITAVVTNMKTGHPEYFTNSETKGTFYKALQASASMPLLSEPVKIKGNEYMDGGCSTKLPIRYALEQGYKKVVFIGTRPLTYRREKIPPEYVLEERAYHKHPNFLESLKKSNQRYNEECVLIQRLVEEGKAFAITPSKPVTVSRIEGDLDKLGNLYWLGYRDGLDNIIALRRYLNMK